MEISLPPPLAICLEDAAILVSRAGAISNEQRESAVQMAETQPSESETPTTSLKMSSRLILPLWNSVFTVGFQQFSIASASLTRPHYLLI